MDKAQIFEKLRDGGRIGLLADTHCHRGGPDLPAGLFDAFRGVDLIVHLGDIGEAWALDRLETIAPVLTTRGADDPQGDPRVGADTQIIEVGGLEIGALFDLARTELATRNDAHIVFSGVPVQPVLRATFGRSVHAVAFGATHGNVIAHQDGVLFVNPGSATLPAPPARATAAILDVRNRVISVEMVYL